MKNKFKGRNNSEVVKSSGTTAIILAGGKSSRMGSDKSLLPINGMTMIEYIIKQISPLFDEILISAGDPEKFQSLNLPVITDIEENKGPLMGIYSCLKASRNALNFVTACDIPNMNIPFIEKMLVLASQAEVVIPVNPKKQYEPLFAIYNKSIVPAISEMLQTGRLQVIGVLEHATAHFVDFENDAWYKNLNQHNDYLEFLKLRGQRG